MGKRRRVKWFSQEKGFDQGIPAFFRAVKTGGELAIPLPSLIATTRAAFVIEESLHTGHPRFT